MTVTLTPPLPDERIRILPAEAVIDCDVHPQQFAARPSRHPRRTANRGLTPDKACDADHNALTCLPGVGDAMGLEVAVERLLDSVG